MFTVSQLVAILMALLMFNGTFAPLRAQAQTQPQTVPATPAPAAAAPQQTVDPLVEAQREVKDAMEKLRKAREVQGKKKLESMTPATPAAQPKPLEGDQTPPSPAAQEVKSIEVTLPPFCASNDLGRIFAAIDKEKERLEGNTEELNNFLAEVRSARSCIELVTLLQKRVDLNALTSVPVVTGPETKAIITEPNDWRLYPYGIGFDKPFTSWKEQLLGTELKAPEDFKKNRQRLLDHIRFFQVPADNAKINSMPPQDRAKLEEKVRQMRDEAPSVLNACLDEPWRWADDVKLCQWMDAADAPIWVTTWATNTLWGRRYNLEHKRNALMLVAWLPKSEEYMFWAGPCGGNGGWLPSGQKVVFNIESLRDVVKCDLIEVVGAEKDPQGNLLMPLGKQQTLHVKELQPSDEVVRLNEERKKAAKSPSEFTPVQRLVEWMWKKDGVVIPNSKGKNEIVVTEPGNYSIENAAVGGNDAKSCSITFVIPPQQPEVVCASLTAKVNGDRVEVTVPIVGETSLISKVEILLDGNIISQNELHKNNSGYWFPYKLVPDDAKPHVITAAVVRTDGIRQECKDKTDRNTITGRPVPTMSCESLTVKQGRNQTQFTLQLNNPERLPYSGYLVYQNQIIAQLNNSTTALVNNDVVAAGGEVNFEGVYGEGKKITCQTVLRAQDPPKVTGNGKRGGFPKWLLIPLIGGGVIAGLCLGKVGICGGGSDPGPKGRGTVYSPTSVGPPVNIGPPRMMQAAPSRSVGIRISFGR